MDTASLIGNVIGLVILFGATVWVFRDAKAIGDDGGRAPGLVNTKPGSWAVGVFLLLILVLPAYLLTRVRYKRLLAERRGQMASLPRQGGEVIAETEGVWPPPPNKPVA